MSPAAPDFAQEFFSATVLRVLHEGGQGQPWRALVKDPVGNRPLYLRLDVPPAGVDVGSDLHFSGVRRPSGSSDIPDEVHVAIDDAEARLAMMANAPAVGLEVSIAQRMADSVARATERVGLQTAIMGAQKGMARFSAAPGVVSVVRPRDSADPAIAWAARRFSDPDTQHLRGAAVLVVEPTALLPRRAPGAFPALQRALDLLRTLTAKGDTADRLRAEFGLTGALPAMQNELSRQGVVRDSLNPRPTHRAAVEDVRGEERPPSVVIPYDASESGSELWRGLTGMRRGFMPKSVVPPQARAMITTAHEIGHAHQAALGFGYTTLADKNGGECFADAVGLMTYVLDTGDEKSAIEWMRERALAPLMGVGTHATGLACAAAIKEARALRAEHGDGEVPLKTILERAARVARENAFTTGEDFVAVHNALASRNADWDALPSAEIAPFIRACVADVTGSLAEPAKIERLFALAADSLPKIAFTPHDLKTGAARKQALAAERQDLADTAAHLRSIGMHAAVPVVLRTSIEANAKNARAARREGLVSVIPNLVAWAETKPSDPAAAGTPLAVVGRAARAVVGKAAVASLGALSALGEAVLPKAVQARLGRLELETVLAAERKAVFSKAALDHLLRGGSAPAPEPRDAVMVIAAKPKGPSVFDLSVDARLNRLSDLVSREFALTERANQAAPEAREAVVADINTVRAQVKTIAFSLRVERQTWDEVRHVMGYTRAEAIQDLATWGRATATQYPVGGIAYHAFKERAESLADFVNNPIERDLARHRMWRNGHPGGVQIDWSNRDLSGVNLIAADLRGARLDGAKLSGANLEDARLADASLSGADLAGANLTHADLRRATLDGAVLTNAALIQVQAQKVNLMHADLTGANLSGAEMKGADLAGASLRDAHLDHVNLQEALLNDADLSRARGQDADLAHANLAGAVLGQADLARPDFRGAQLGAADFSDASIRGGLFQGARNPQHARFEGARLVQPQGLEGLAARVAPAPAAPAAPVAEADPEATVVVGMR